VTSERYTSEGRIGTSRARAWAADRNIFAADAAAVMVTDTVIVADNAAIPTMRRNIPVSLPPEAIGPRLCVFNCIGSGLIIVSIATP
jgi:hypothetical protein